MSNMGAWSNCRSAKFGGEKPGGGGVGAAALKKDSCIEASCSASSPGVEDEEPSVEGLAAGTGSRGLLSTIESAKY